MRWTRSAVLAATGLGGLAAGVDLRPGDLVAAVRATSPRSAVSARSARTGGLPLAFEENLGQTDERVRFMARAGGITAFVTATETVFALHSASAGGARRDRRSPSDEDADVTRATEVVRMSFAGGNASPSVEARGRLPGKCNYFLGADPSKWVTGAATFEGVVVREVYPGVDVHWHGDVTRRLTYDLAIAPGADVRAIEIALEGARDLTIGDDGALRAATDLGELRQSRPVAFQTIDGARRPVAAAFALTSDGRVRFHVGAYDAARALVIDPSLTYSTLLGGSGSEARWVGVAVGSDGASYVGGTTRSSNFPLQSPYQATLASAGVDAFVTKLNSTGSAVIYSTYLGGSSADHGEGIAVDSAGAAYVCGQTHSSNFPTLGAFQSARSGAHDAFVAKLGASGSSLSYSTYLGGAGEEGVGTSIAVDAYGSAYVLGATESSDFPTQSALQSVYRGANDAFVSKLSESGSTLVYSTFLGGSGWEHGFDIAVDSSGGAYVTGRTTSTDFPIQSAVQSSYGGGGDTFVAKINSSGSALAYSTFLGGSGDDSYWESPPFYNEGTGGISVDEFGAAFVTGTTYSSNFPMQSAYQSTPGGGGDAFVTKLSASGSALIYSTYLGGSDLDVGSEIAAGYGGTATVSVSTLSSDFPVATPTQSSYAGGGDGVVARFNSTGSVLLFSSYLGGSARDQTCDIALDELGDACVVGLSASTDFPVQSPIQTAHGGGVEDVFVAKFPLGGGGTPGPAPAAPINLVASYQDGACVVLDWEDRSTDETGFRVERKPTGYSFGLLTTTSANATSHVDDLLNPSVTYTYRVRAFNANGNSAWSNDAIITTDGRVPPPPLPRAPSQLALVAGDDGANWLSWTDNSRDEVVFGLERAVGGEGFRTLAALRTDVTAFADFELHPGWPCAYRVRALALQGPSPYSNVATATLPSTLDVTVVSGTLTDSKKPRRDKLTLSARYAFPSASATGAAFDPVAGGLELQLGAANAPVSISIAPGVPPWKVTKHKRRPVSATWRSAKGVFPKVTVVVNLVRRSLKATVVGADFADAPTPVVRVLVACGSHGGAHSATWTERRSGEFRFK